MAWVAVNKIVGGNDKGGDSIHAQNNRNKPLSVVIVARDYRATSGRDSERTPGASKLVPGDTEERAAFFLKRNLARRFLPRSRLKFFFNQCWSLLRWFTTLSLHQGTFLSTFFAAVAVIFASVVLKLGTCGILRIIRIIELIYNEYKFVNIYKCEKIYKYDKFYLYLMRINLSGMLLLRIIRLCQLDIKLIVAIPSIAHIGIILIRMVLINKITIIRIDIL